jgi:hypothetical protein
MASELQIPGSQIERAIANVAEDGGKTLIGALRTRMSAWVDKKAAADVATAEEIRLDIADDGQRARERKAVVERRQYELEEVDHRLALIERARGRVLDEIARTQETIEYVGGRAIEFNAADADSADEREIEEDWLSRFFRYVAEVDEKAILDIFAKALADSAIRTRPLLSPRALDTLRFFEAYSFEMFGFCADLIGTFEAVPRGFLERRAGSEGRELDLSLLMEMGLIKYEHQSYYNAIVGGFDLSFYYAPSSREQIELARLTHVGRSIAGLVKPEHRELVNPLAFQGTREEVLALQLALSLTPGAAKDLGKSIVASLASANAIELQVRVNGQQRFMGKKESYDDPFGVTDAVDLEGLPPMARDLARIVIAELVDFDTNQLEAMRGQPAIYRDDPPSGASA